MNLANFMPLWACGSQKITWGVGYQFLPSTFFETDQSVVAAELGWKLPQILLSLPLSHRCAQTTDPCTPSSSFWVGSGDSNSGC